MEKHLFNYRNSPTLITSQKPCPQVYLIHKDVKFLMKMTYSTAEGDLHVGIKLFFVCPHLVCNFLRLKDLTLLLTYQFSLSCD